MINYRQPALSTLQTSQKPNEVKKIAAFVPPYKIHSVKNTESTSCKTVARATTINRIQYAGPAWWGYANAADKGQIQRFLERMFKSGFLTEQDTDIESQMTKIIISAIYMVKLSLRSGLPTFHDYG